MGHFCGASCVTVRITKIRLPQAYSGASQRIAHPTPAKGSATLVIGAPPRGPPRCRELLTPSGEANCGPQQGEQIVPPLPHSGRCDLRVPSRWKMVPVGNEFIAQVAFRYKSPELQNRCTISILLSFISWCPSGSPQRDDDSARYIPYSY